MRGTYLLTIAALALLAAPAAASERRVTIGATDRLRVEGPYKVTVRTGAASGLTLSGDRAAIDAVDVHSDGGLLAIRSGGALSGGGPAQGREPVVVTVSTPALRGAIVVGAAVVAIGPMAGQTVDLSISGSGTLSVAAVDTPRLVAMLIGNGGLTIGGGKAASGRLVGNGGGTIDAATVQVGDLTAHQDGAGAIRAAARFTAQVIDTGLGTISVAGNPRCTVRAPAGGSVTCGLGAR